MTTEIEGNYYLELAKDQTTSIWKSNSSSLENIEQLRDDFQDVLMNKHEGFIEFDDFNGINTTIPTSIIKSSFIYVKEMG